MSVVVAIKDGDTVYMAADTMVTLGESKRHLKSSSSQKIWKVEDTPNCIMGGVGYLRDINLIRYCTRELVPEAHIIKEEIDVGVIMSEMVPVIFTSIKEYSKIVDLEERSCESEFMWAFKNRLFHIMGDGLVEEVEDFEAIGSGADAALASLQHTEGQDVYVRLIKALEAASYIDLHVSDPYVCMDTANTELGDLYFGEGADDDDDDDIVEDLCEQHENIAPQESSEE